MPGQADPFFIDIAHLILEVSSDGQVFDIVNLLSRESSPGIWDTEQRLVL
jgi:hypothetical protein